MPRISFENSSIYYDIKGSGKTVLLLHGFLESSTMWDDYSVQLSSIYQIIRIDLPGHGQSENTEVHSMDKMAEAVHYILTALNIKSISVIGHSMGGYVALALAEKYPKPIKSIMLFFSSAAADTTEKRENRDRLKAIVAKDKEGFMRHAIPMLFTKVTRESFASEIELLIKDAQELSTEGIAKTLEGLKTRPDRQSLLAMNFPVSFVSGKLDEAITLDSLKQQHSAKGVKNVWLTENGHMGHIEDQDFCFAAIHDFLAQKKSRKTGF